MFTDDFIIGVTTSKREFCTLSCCRALGWLDRTSTSHTLECESPAAETFPVRFPPTQALYRDWRALNCGVNANHITSA